MTYFLDFDRTLFDTESFKGYLAGRPDTAPYRDLPELELAALLNKKIVSGELTFAPNELSQFLYADVTEFLRAMGNEATIITFGNPDLQRMKIISALHGIPRVTAFYTGDIRKGLYLAPRIDSYINPILVDDAPIELELLTEHSPQVRGFEMRRDSGPGDGRWPVVRSLAELP